MYFAPKTFHLRIYFAFTEQPLKVPKGMKLPLHGTTCYCHRTTYCSCLRETAFWTADHCDATVDWPGYVICELDRLFFIIQS